MKKKKKKISAKIPLGQQFYLGQSRAVNGARGGGEVLLDHGKKTG
jgi:hypothetical protein